MISALLRRALKVVVKVVTSGSRSSSESREITLALLGMEYGWFVCLRGVLRLEFDRSRRVEGEASIT